MNKSRVDLTITRLALYLGGLRITSGSNTEDIVRKHFGEFGTIEFSKYYHI
jgi:hypothetical protein